MLMILSRRPTGVSPLLGIVLWLKSGTVEKRKMRKNYCRRCFGRGKCRVRVAGRLEFLLVRSWLRCHHGLGLERR
uniref:Uncharacterized protein n=1 Tax=Anguilla anguilla TaxID=7936 RepID=A0A0E9WAK1_ANGAN